MIQIDKVAEENYSFPTVDFKFQNSGDATAFLWQFAIQVLTAEVDVTPVVTFPAGVQDGALEVNIANNGWGKALDGQFRLRDGILDKLFPENVLRYSGTVEAGATAFAFRLTKDLAIPELWNTILASGTIPSGQDHKRDEPLRFRRVHEDTQATGGIVLDQTQVEWDCKEEKRGENHQGKTPLVFRRRHSYVALTDTGFEIHQHMVAECPARSDVTYITMLDPVQGSHERIYPIARKIEAGDIERFHIMIGASMSCRLRVKFRFSIDKSSVIESEEFGIHIWNPRNSGKSHRYKDGSELKRKLDSGQVFTDDFWDLGREVDVLLQAHEYPFKPPKRHSY
jgi:hypothetical protein